MPESIEQAVEEANRWLLIEGVEGLGQGETGGKPCIVVLVSRPAESFADKIPSEYKGYPVIIEETGEIRPL